MAQDKIIRMANQIAAFMQSKPEAEALAGFAAISMISGHRNCGRNSSIVWRRAPKCIRWRPRPPPSCAGPKHLGLRIDGLLLDVAPDLRPL